MVKSTTIEAALARNVRAFQAKPTVAQDTTTAQATLRDGFLTVTREGEHEMTADMPEIMGGSGGAPTPGVLGRACLASCIAMGIKIAATRRGLPIEEIAVDLSMDWDNRGIFGMDGISAGPSNVDIQLTLISPAEEAELREVVDEGLKNDPWLLALTQPHEVRTRLQVKGEA